MNKLVCAFVLSMAAVVGFAQIPLNVTPANTAVENVSPITATASGTVPGTNAAIVLKSLAQAFNTGTLLNSNHVVMINATLVNTNGDWFVIARFCAGTNSLPSAYHLEKPTK